MLSAGGLFAGMLLLFELGRCVGRRRLSRDPDGVTTGAGPVEAAVFGLLGLLLALTLTGAASRFEDRRHLIAEETNAIGTAYLRIDLLPREAQPDIRNLFRRYVSARLTSYRDGASQADSLELQDRIWSAAIAAYQRPDATPHAAMLVTPALNAMIDITTTRAVALQNHPPRVIYFLLAALSLFAALLAGYVMSRTRLRSWLYMLLVSGTMSVTLFVILDMEYPRFGLIRIDAADRTLAELQQHMLQDRK
jgi:hypothetical protein